MICFEVAVGRKNWWEERLRGPWERLFWEVMAPSRGGADLGAPGELVCLDVHVCVRAHAARIDGGVARPPQYLGLPVKALKKPLRTRSWGG